MSRFWDGIRENPFNLLNPASYSAVDPDQGSQGASRDVPGGAAASPVLQGVSDFFGGLGQEGIGGLLDYSGMMDRQNAQRELASRFNVLPDGTAGERSQNQVSEEQFREIARTYSDIRLGRGDLTLGERPANMSDDDYAQFRTGAMGDVADILQTESGRGLIGSLHDAPRQADGETHRATTINPRVDAAGALDASNAEGGGMFAVSGYANYVPGQDTLPTGDNLRSDVTLYHELTHAHHAVYNTWDGANVTTGADTGIGQFEHQAAGLGNHANNAFSENRYRGERREIGALGVGARTAGAETDADMTHRDTYSLPYAADGTPIARSNPAFVPTTNSGSGGAGGGAVAAGRVGRATSHDHDHDHDHRHAHYAH